MNPSDLKIEIVCRDLPEVKAEMDALRAKLQAAEEQNRHDADADRACRVLLCEEMDEWQRRAQAAEAEVARLKAITNRMVMVDHGLWMADGDIHAIEMENEKLREALEKIAMIIEGDPDYRECSRIARSALLGGGEGEE